MDIERNSGDSVRNKGFYSSVEVLDPLRMDKRKVSSEIILNVKNIENEASGSPSHRIEWRNLQFDVRKKNLQFKSVTNIKLVPFERQILQPQTGCIKSGEMTALMGPSGAGKTTLLNAITGKCDSRYVTGDINFVTSTAQGNNKRLLKLSYVPQKDFLFQEFTIRETLTFAYKFNSISAKENLSGHEIKMKVEKLALDINLTVALDTKVSECSGGQVKRVSVAIELISNPNILILDEPTTGLDSVNASVIITVIKNLLAKKSNFDNNNENYTPPAVICAIHQPSIEVFNLFDQIYVLADGGKNIYSGHPSKVPEMLAANDVIITVTANPADFLLMLCQSKKEIKTVTSTIEANEDEIVTKISSAKKETDRSYGGVNFFSTVGILLQRQIKMVRYNPWPIIIRSLFCIISTVCMNSMYDHVIGSHSGCYNEMFGFNDPPSNESLAVRLTSSNFERIYYSSLRNMSQVLDNVGFLLISTMFIVVVHCFMTLVEIPAEIKIISKEVANHWYSINSYITARLLVTFVVIICHISFFTWFMMTVTSQILDWERYLLITGTWILLAWISELTGFTIGTFFHTDLITAVLMQIVAMFPLFLFSGFFVKPTAIPAAVKPLTYISQMKHVFEAMVIILYGKGRCSPASENELTFTQFLKLSPLKMLGRFMKSNNITHEASSIMSPMLQLSDNVCLAQVINATRSIADTEIEMSVPIDSHENITEHFSYDYDESYNSARTSKVVDEIVSVAEKVSAPEDLALPLSMFGISEDDLQRCYLSLVILLLMYIILMFLTLRRIVKVNF